MLGSINKIMIFIGSVLMCSAFNFNIIFTAIIGLITILMIMFIPFFGITEGILLIWVLIGHFTHRLIYIDYIYLTLAIILWIIMIVYMCLNHKKEG